MTNPYGTPRGYPPQPPPPQQQPPPPPPPQPPIRADRVMAVPRDGKAMATLRVIAYLLTSLASLLFIALVIYGYIQLRQAQAALDGLLGGGGLPSFPKFGG